MSIIKTGNNNIVDFSITNQDSLMIMISYFLKPIEMINFITLCKEMLKIKNIFLDIFKINNIAKLNFILKKYNVINTNYLLLDYNLKNNNINNLYRFVNIKKLHITNKVSKINEILKYYTNMNITNVVFSGNIFFTDKIVFADQTTILYDILNNFLSYSKIKSISFLNNSVSNNYNQINFTNITKASFLNCDFSILNLPVMNNLMYLEITTNLLSNIDRNDILKLLNNKFPKLKILYITKSFDDDDNEIINLANYLIIHSNLLLKLTDSDQNIIISFFNFKNINNIKEFNKIIEDIISMPRLKYLLIIMEKIQTCSQLFLLLYYFAVAKKINIIYKTGKTTNIVKKNIKSSGILNLKFDNL